MKLSKRLSNILNIIKYKTLADIGTDHAYLPIKACEQGIIDMAIATDINKGPLEIAVANIKKAKLEHKINIRHGNGLDVIQPNEADTIIIAGMGGVLIWDIIQNGLNIAKETKQLILSPQHNIENLRKNLIAGGFNITNEIVIQEGLKFYIIIECNWANEYHIYTDKEYFLGKYKKGSWRAFFKSEYTRIQKYIEKNKQDIIKLQWINEEMSKECQVFFQ